MAGKFWFVTGSSRGLGRAIVQAALQAGDRVVATARRPGQLADLAAEHGQSILVLPLDVTEDDTAASAAGAAVARFGRIDVLVNNAGYATLASVEDMGMDDFRAQVGTNLLGVVAVTKAVLPVMRQQRSGHIINVSSLGARVATPGLAAYQAAKWAVSGFTEVLALETAPLGIKVTAIEPGGMATDWAGSSMSKPPVSQAYQPSVGMVAARMREPELLPAGDPARIARVVVNLSEMDSPPARLLLGSDAVTIAEAAATALAGRDATWREVSRSTDRDDATAADLDPLGVAAPGPVTVVRRFLDEVVNGDDLDLIDELWAEDLAWHGGSLGDISGLPAFR